MNAITTLPNYQVSEQLYVGTRTLVYRGIRNIDHKKVVIKILSNEYPSFNELIQFRNQYTIAKNLDSPNIITTYSLETYNNSYALIMEDFGGISLKEWRVKETELSLLSLREFLEIAIALCNTLDILYRERIIHKDIKPANILINPTTKQIKLIDFSIASLLPRETQEFQNANSLEGTLAYLSPEQTGRMNRGIDYRSDFYSLGITFYELLTGKLPFQSNDPMELVHCHLAKTPVFAHQINPQIPLVLSEIITKLMAKNAEDRYQSALGIRHDLELCLEQLQTTGSIGSFEIGKRDLSDRFTIPEKLYGREQEVQALLNAFDRIAGGSPQPPLKRGASENDPLKRGALEDSFGSEMMLVAGFSGIGKTAVINEVHKPIARQRGYFIKGKYDQFQRNIPFSAFVQAFRDLMGQLLSESDAQLQIWKSKILEVVSDNGQVLIEVIPELELIIGKQPIATELSGTAAQNRFNLLIQNFVKVFASQEHPLVIFIDDLQWSDSASQNLLKLLMQDTKYLLILGAYRDNEVSPAHPFILAVEEIVKTGVVVNTIMLQPLSLLDTNYLVADTLNCELPIAQPLTELVYQKTIGNPFFTTQFLKSLYEDKQIIFDQKERYWQCDIAKVKALAITDDVVEFMALQLQRLPLDTQNALKLAACIGAQFDLNTLAIISQKSAEVAARELWKALQEGLIIPNTESYKFFIQSDTVSSADAPANPIYRFLHDRVQQAAYSLIPEENKQITHLKIGQLIKESCSKQEREEKIFDIVGHLNMGRTLITQTRERTELAQLNLIAGKKARLSTAYDAAIAYFTTGMELLPQDPWESSYKLTLALHESAGEVAYLIGQFGRFDEIAAITLQSAKTLLDKITTYETQIQVYVAQNYLAELMQTSLNVLSELGIQLPKSPNIVQIVLGLAKTKLILAGKTKHDLLNLPIMSSPEKLAAMRMLSSALNGAFLSGSKLFPLLMFQQINLSVRSGNTSLSAAAYSCYGIILCGVLGDINQGYEFGQLALQILDQFNAKNLRSKVLCTVNSTIFHWKQHLRFTLSGLQEGYQIGLETGDLESASECATAKGNHLYWCGYELSSLAQTLHDYSEIIKQAKQDKSLVYASIYYQATLNLIGESSNPSLLEGSAYSAMQKASQKAAGDRTGLFLYYVNQIYLSYLFGEVASACEQVILAKQYAEGLTILYVTVPLYLYDSLSQLRLYPHSTKSKQRKILRHIAKNQQKLHKWAGFAPMNTLHKWCLVEAEKCRVLGRNAEAIEMYDRAISGAKENEYIQEEALANELAAKFYLDWGKEKIAQVYMIEAYYCYSRWGAKAKVVDLETCYPQLLQPILQQPISNFNALETLTSIAHSATKLSSTSISDSLDFASVIQAAQALSSAIELDELVKQLTQIILQNSGGSKCVLVLPQDEIWQVRAIATPETTELCSIPLDDHPDVPIKLIQYVKRTQSVVVIDNLQTDLPVIDNYLIQLNPKSILCLPILNQGNLVGILYLKNKITAGVFTSDRLTIINFLCTQAAISLENAQLYQESQTYAQELKQSQLQMIQSEKMSALGNLVAGVAHEINNPVGFLSGNIKPALDYINDLFGLIDLVQQKYPQLDPEIQEEIETIDLEYIREDLPKLVGSMREGVKRIQDISTSLRTFSRADTDYPVACNIHDGINSTIMILKHRLKADENRPEIQVIKDYGNLPKIECYAGQLNQVFMNILGNAIDALDESNQARTFAEIRANPNCITVTTSVENSYVKIAIADNGKGISEEVKQKVFDHLFTTKEVGKGTGLGLAIARQIIEEKHGGIIEVSSAVGKGTQFSILLPITRSA